ncbi:hypothetical protein [Flavisolibacter ginsenosidimutans]|uniref:Uncharacterized protein n=1 Tax=Flavisolibacter ginsenosidimutans TaxID=661481 RepID=A0A5B8UDZ5_9BACT|nr:hypothetical protein [Flavisolibacter ginsenosidimutans]QEC54723.1 hypothetical protein FSB75_02010 [Flavisolibacter ginsenosidimutans]
MDEHKHSHRSEEHRSSDDDQLRDLTTNETIREVSGEADLSKSDISREHTGHRTLRDEDEISGTDLSQGVSYNPNDASAVRSGGTTDMDDQTAGGAGLAAGERGSSNLMTRRNVTGSDFDGQNKTS